MPTILMFGVIFGILYLLVLRPQKKQEDERKAMVGALKKNDRVITNGGIMGIIVSVKDEEVVLRIDEEKNVKMRLLKSAIGSVETDKSSKGASG